MQIFGLLIDFVWKVMSIPLKFDNFTFTLWQFIFTIFLICFIIKLIIKNHSGGGGHE